MRGKGKLESQMGDKGLAYEGQRESGVSDGGQGTG